MDDRTIGIDPECNLAKLLRIFKPRLSDDRRVQLLTFQRRRTAQLTRGDLIVLNLQRIDDVDRREVVFIQQIAVQPDAHGVLRAEQLHIAHAVEAADRVFHVGGDIVRNIVLGGGRVIRDKAGNQQEAAAGFFDANPLLLYFLRQQRRSQLQFVLHLHLGDIRIGAGLKGERNGYRPGGVAGRRHIHQVVDTVHILFDNLSDRILHGLGIRTRVGGGDRHRRGRNRRILRYR